MIMRYTREQLSQMKGLTDWDRLEKLTDEVIEKAIAEDPDSPPIFTDEDWARATVFVPPSQRRMVTMRIDEDVITWFSQFGRGYQSRINEVLKAYVAAQTKPGR